MALFITFEGGEGSGKSLQARALYRRLIKASVPSLLTYEPGGTPLGKKLRFWLKWAKGMDISPLTELMLFNASRAQLVSGVIKPSLENGVNIICDRFADSTIVYQGYGRGLDLDTVTAVNNAATQGLLPDLTILLDIPVDIGLARKKAGSSDRFEQEKLAFHQRVRDGYIKLAEAQPERWFIINAGQPVAAISDTIWEKVSLVMSTHQC